MARCVKRSLGVLFLVAGVLGSSPAEAQERGSGRWERRFGRHPASGWAYGVRRHRAGFDRGVIPDYWGRDRDGDRLPDYRDRDDAGFGMGYARGRRHRHRTPHTWDGTPWIQPYYYSSFPGYRTHTLRYRRGSYPDFDGDGIPDSRDGDIDGDGMRNRRDWYDWDPFQW
jgi:hypothetical protein